jgi:taurine dioxygenase
MCAGKAGFAARRSRPSSAKKPPVSQPIFRVHPITGRTVLYCNPGYAVQIDGIPEDRKESRTCAVSVLNTKSMRSISMRTRTGGRRADLRLNIGTQHNAGLK